MWRGPRASARRCSRSRRTSARLEAAPTFLDTVTRIVVDNVAAPFKLAGPVSRVLPKLSVAAMKMLSRALFAPAGGAPRTRFNQPVSSQRVFESVVFDFATIKRIRAAVPGATVNDVALAIVGGAMRRYLESKKELPAQSLVALSPVNTRQDAGERQTTGNMISFLTFSLASDIADPLARLAKIRETTSQTKALSNAIGAHDLSDISKHAAPATLAFAGRLATMTGLGGMGPLVLHNCVVSNVPGANVDLDDAGREALLLVGRRADRRRRGRVLRGEQHERPHVHLVHELPEDGARPRVLRRLHPCVDRGTGRGRDGRHDEDVRRAARRLAKGDGIVKNARQTQAAGTRSGQSAGRATSRRQGCIPAQASSRTGVTGRTIMRERSSMPRSSKVCRPAHRPEMAREP